MDYVSASEAGNCCSYRNPQRRHVVGRRILRNGLKGKAQRTLTTHNVCPIDMLNCLHVKRKSHNCEADICGKGSKRCSQTYYVYLDTSEDDPEDDSRWSAQEHSAHCPKKWSEDVSKEHIKCSAQEPSTHHRGKRSEDVSKERSRWSAQEPAAHRWRNCYGGVSKESVR
ncbi:hypothetical protein O6H91_11G026300 [Diphasiastrum complanatum]|uniref:Uncharacterized protein n=1 Tax=Diphasiastrum complanatum TaxID=34168 RepID=A0ACC2C7B3_DIPCM|nr:hypothetical protein O6H91_11G026300 [Diphasiastrum complanatum]